MRGPPPQRAAAGFTLIELAVALFIVALMLGGLLGPLAVRIEQNDRSETRRALEEIKEALYGFAITNGRLPCPYAHDPTDAIDASDPEAGFEDRTGGTCDAGGAGGFALGTLPWANLGVGRSDAWGHPFAYGVMVSFSDDSDGAADEAWPPPDPDNPPDPVPPCSQAPAPGVSFELCSVAWGRVEDGAGGVVLDDTPAIVISYGGNWGQTPAAGSDEEENQDGDNVAVDAGYRRDAFDDMLIWLSPVVLKSRMVQAGLLP